MMNSMKRLLLTWFALMASVATSFSAFPYETYTGTFSGTASSTFTNFLWQWNDMTDAKINVTFNQAGYSSVVFRLAYPQGGSAYLTVYGGVLVAASTSATYAVTIDHTNIPPPKVYFAEFLAALITTNVTTNSSSVVSTNLVYSPSRILASGLIRTRWSTFNATNTSTWQPVSLVVTGVTGSLSELDPLALHSSGGVALRGDMSLGLTNDLTNAASIYGGTNGWGITFGPAPSAVNSSHVTNFNADLLDGQHWTYYARQSDLAYISNNVGSNAVGSSTVISGSVAGTVSSGLWQQADTVASSNVIDGTLGIADMADGVRVSLTNADAVFAWGSWSQGIYGVVASDLYLGSNGYPQIRTGVVTTVEILNGTVAAADMATNVGVSTFLNDSGYLTTSAAQIVFFPTNGALGGSVYGTPTNVLFRTNSVGSAQVTDGTLTTDDVALAGFDARYLNTAQMRTNSGGLWMSNNIYFIRGPSASPGSFNIYFFEAGYTSFVNSAQGKLYVGGNLGQGLLWGSGNDGSGSTLDADLIDGMDSTNFPLSSAIWPVVSNLVLYSVSTTSDQPHRVKTDFVVGDSLWSATNLWLGSTNGVMSTNMLVNGNFTGDAAWVMTGGAAWNAGSTGILTCSAGTTGSAIQSNRFGATPGTWVFRYVCLVPPATGSLVASFGGDSFYQTGNLTGRVEYVFTPDTTDTFSFTMNSTNGLISVDEFELFHLHTGDGGVGGNWSVGGKLSASNGVFSGTISGNATGYLPLVEGGEVLGGVTLHALDIRDTTFTLYDSYPSENTVFEQNGVDLWLTQSGQIYQNATNLVWHAGNDGSGSGLDADLLDGKSSTGFVSNLPGVTLPAMDAGALTNLPPSTSTNSVSGIKVSEATNVYVGTVALNSSATIQFSATATGPTASVLSGALTGLPGGGVTGGLNAGILTGSVPLAALGNVAQTGQVNQATNLPQAAAIKVLATSDGGTTTYYKADDTGTIAFTNAPLAASAMVVASTDGGTSLFLKAEALASSNIVTISSWPIYAAETWTAQYSVIEAFDIFDTATPLTQFGGLIDGGTATVDLINFAPGATTWTTNSTMLLVGVTSIVPSAALSASNHLGIQIRPGATVTNEMRLFVRGWR